MDVSTCSLFYCVLCRVPSFDRWYFISPRQHEDNLLHNFIMKKCGEEFPESVLRSFTFSLLPYITRRACKGIAVCIFEREVGTQTIFNGHAHEVENLGNVVKVCHHVPRALLRTFLTSISFHCEKHDYGLDLLLFAHIP